MRSSRMIRLCGLAAMAGGLSWIVWNAGAYFVPWGTPSTPEYEVYEAYNRLIPVVMLFLALGLAGFYAAQRERSGRLSMVGFFISFAGLALMASGSAAEFWLFTDQPYADSDGFGRGVAFAIFLLGLLTFAIGTALFGVATLKAGILPRLGALLLMVWLPVGVLSGVLADLTGVLPADLAFPVGMAATLGTGWMMLGYVLAAGESGYPRSADTA